MQVSVNVIVYVLYSGRDHIRHGGSVFAMYQIFTQGNDIFAIKRGEHAFAGLGCDLPIHFIALHKK